MEAVEEGVHKIEYANIIGCLSLEDPIDKATHANVKGLLKSVLENYSK